MIRAVIFDFNGLLVDDESVHFDLFREALAEVGVSLDEATYRDRYLGFDDRGCFQAALRDSGRRAVDDLVDDLIARKARRYFEAARKGLRFFPGSTEAVQGLATRWPLAICSGALRSEIELALHMMGVQGRIGAIIAAEDTVRCKPDPEGYLLALDALRSRVGEDLEAAHCLAVEDSLAGIEAVKAAGMWAVGIAHTYPEDQLREAGADAVLGDLSPLDPAWIDHFFHPEITP